MVYLAQVKPLWDEIRVGLLQNKWIGREAEWKSIGTHEIESCTKLNPTARDASYLDLICGISSLVVQM